MKARFTLIWLVIGLVTIMGLRYVQASQTKPEFQPHPSTFELNPPQQAVIATLVQTTGKVEKLSRNDGEFYEASPGASIYQGEAVATQARSNAMIDVGGLINITLEGFSEVSFANLLPDGLLLHQKSGRATYIITGSVQPVSVRVPGAVAEISTGEITVRIADPDVYIIVKSGSVKIAAVDSENFTRVTTLLAGESAVIDGATNRVEKIQRRN